MKPYKYQALVKLLQRDSGQTTVLAGSASRMVVRVQDPETHATRLFSALVSASSDQLPGSSHVLVTVTVLGDDTGECLDVGEDVALWRGADIARGVVTRRVFI